MLLSLWSRSSKIRKLPNFPCIRLHRPDYENRVGNLASRDLERRRAWVCEDNRIFALLGALDIVCGPRENLSITLGSISDITGSHLAVHGWPTPLRDPDRLSARDGPEGKMKFWKVVAPSIPPAQDEPTLECIAWTFLRMPLEPQQRRCGSTMLFCTQVFEDGPAPV